MPFKILVSGFIFIAVFTANSQALPSARGPSVNIIGGTPVSPKDLISAVAVKVVIFPGNRVVTCSGTLISPTVVLTAAHCATPQHPPTEIVLFNGMSSPVLQTVVHPKAISFAGQLVYDFALLKIKDIGIKFFADLPTTALNLARGDQLQIAGYGARNDSPASDYGLLYSLPVVVVNPNVSETAMLVAEGPGRGACYGDSGGPAYFIKTGHIVVVGVDSQEGAVLTPGKCGQAEKFSNVTQVIPWVNSYLR